MERDVTLDLIWNGYKGWYRVFFKGEQPTDTSMDETLFFLRVLGLYPSKFSEESLFYIIYSSVMTFLLVSFTLCILADVYDVSSNIIMVGEDLTISLGTMMVYLKMFVFRVNKKQVQAFIAEILSLQNKFSTESAIIRNIQRQRYIRDVLIFSSFFVLGNVLTLAFIFTPILFGEARTLPFRVKLPFSIEDDKTFILVFLYQSFATCVFIKAEIHFDNIVCITINQTATNLDIICEKMKELLGKKISHEDLGEIISNHQRIIRLVDLVNDTLYYNFMGQIVCSTFLICMTAFMFQLSKGQPAVAIKFELFMLILFMQLLYVCWVGNAVHSNSVKMAEIAYELEWINHSPRVRRDLMFLILRSQKPLMFRADPLFGFDFEAFSRILSSSYSVFTMLRTFDT